MCGWAKAPTGAGSLGTRKGGRGCLSSALATDLVDRSGVFIMGNSDSGPVLMPPNVAVSCQKAREFRNGYTGAHALKRMLSGEAWDYYFRPGVSLCTYAK